ncbi:hypothetical protein GCM10023149_37110 [Mucilaginibacter gynuensis]|uniref:Endonuclease/exonuclease/phosphatase domain-containing protein n=2 Tax=Mucilaginibacter gynuensis TaxID=1302236 RepID=A0ABP8GYB0_9SPHI
MRIMTWNVHHFQPLKGKSKILTHQMLKLIDSVNPDILCLQEYYDQTNRRIDITDSIKRIMHTEYAYFQPVKKKYTGIAIFSKYPIIYKKNLNNSMTACDQCIIADILIHGRVQRVYALHLQSYFLPLKQAGQSDLTYAASVVNSLKMGFIKRSRQVNQLSKEIRTSPYPVILTGDFNDPPASYTFHKLSKGLINTFKEQGSGYGSTYAESLLPFQIDYILVPKNTQVQHYRVVRQKLSDHYPVVADISK